METSLKVLVVWLVKAKGLKAHVQYPCQVYRHTTMRSELAPLAGVLQPVVGRPKVGSGLDIEPPHRGPTCVGADGPGLVRQPCFFACTYWPALHGQGASQRREEVEVGREEQESKLRKQASDIAHCTK